MQKIFYLLELFISTIQGKGFGSRSIKKEVSSVTKFLSETPKIILDIGGNKGKYSKELRKYYPDSEIHIFEPSPKNLTFLNENFQDSKVTIVPKATSDVAGEAKLYSEELGSGLSSLADRKLDHFGINFVFSEKIQTIRIEDYWKDELHSKDIDFVKIDVEGFELKTLIGFGKALESTKVIQFEFGGANIDTRTFFQDFWYFFENNKFDLYRITPMGTVKLSKYREIDEVFRTTNYIAVRKNKI